MKKIITIFCLTALMASCGDGVEASAEAAANEVLKTEINHLDSISSALEQSGVEIDETRDELNSLLEGL